MVKSTSSILVAAMLAAPALAAPWDGLYEREPVEKDLYAREYSELYERGGGAGGAALSAVSAGVKLFGKHHNKVPHVPHVPHDPHSQSSGPDNRRRDLEDVELVIRTPAPVDGPVLRRREYTNLFRREGGDSHPSSHHPHSSEHGPSHQHSHSHEHNPSHEHGPGHEHPVEPHHTHPHPHPHGHPVAQPTENLGRRELGSGHSQPSQQQPPVNPLATIQDIVHRVQEATAHQKHQNQVSHEHSTPHHSLSARDLGDILDERGLEELNEILAREYDESLYERGLDEDLYARELDDDLEFFAREYDEEELLARELVEDLRAREIEDEDFFAREFSDEDFFPREYDEDLFARELYFLEELD